MINLSIEENADAVMMIIDNTYGFYTVKQTAFQDNYEKRLKGERFNNRLRFLIEDAMTWTAINEIKSEGNVPNEDSPAVYKLIRSRMDEQYKEFVEFQNESKA